MSAKLRLLLSTMLFCLAVTSCGGGSQGTGSFDSGVDRTKELRRLTPDERNRLCGRAEEFWNAIFAPKAICTYAGISIAIDDHPANPVDDCSFSRDVCIEHFDELSIPPFKCTLEQQPLFNCTEQVSVLEECYADSFQAISDPFSALTCSLASDPHSLDGVTSSLNDPQLATTEACEQLQKNCGLNSF